jgi:hypothetical protein
LRLEIANGALDSLTRFSLGTAMLCAGDRVPRAGGEVTNWNTHSDELPVFLGRKQSQNTHASGDWSCPRLERRSEHRLLLRAFQEEANPVERCDGVLLLCRHRRDEKEEHASHRAENDSHLSLPGFHLDLYPNQQRIEKAPHDRDNNLRLHEEIVALSIYQLNRPAHVL